ncbi:hypothetical protein LEMLEM_LOCUS23998, partial [Lemmus lemmus]
SRQSTVLMPGTHQSAQATDTFAEKQVRPQYHPQVS